MTEKQEMIAKVMGLQLGSAIALAISAGVEMNHSAYEVREQFMALAAELLDETIAEMGL